MRNAGLAMFVHIVWGTWDRLPLITDSIQPKLYHAIGAECTALKAEILALGGVEDHVHVLVSLPATISLAQLLKQMKGASAHLMTHAVAPDQFFRWQGAYGAVSVSPEDIPAACDYIKRQREHHAQQTLISAWELPDPFASASPLPLAFDKPPHVPERLVSPGPIWTNFDDD
jgi:putative transposase